MLKSMFFCLFVFLEKLQCKCKHRLFLKKHTSSFGLRRVFGNNKLLVSITCIWHGRKQAWSHLFLLSSFLCQLCLPTLVSQVKNMAWLHPCCFVILSEQSHCFTAAGNYTVRPHELDLVTLSLHQMRDFVENFNILENSDSLRLTPC